MTATVASIIGRASAASARRSARRGRSTTTSPARRTSWKSARRAHARFRSVRRRSPRRVRFQFLAQRAHQCPIRAGSSPPRTDPRSHSPPLDGRAPKRLAFIHVYGSRDSACGNDFCSSVCCMAATKEAILAREHEPGLEVTIFFLDLRAFGEEFDRYCERARRSAFATCGRSFPAPTKVPRPEPPVGLRQQGDEAGRG